MGQASGGSPSGANDNARGGLPGRLPF